MKNQYVGDIGDYGKYGLLRFLAQHGIMKKGIVIIAAALLFLLTACSRVGQVMGGDGMVRSYTQISQDEAKEMMAQDDGHVIVDVRRPAADTSPESKPEPQMTDEEKTDMQLKIGDTEVPVTWEENDSVNALREIVKEEPLTIQMSMYGGFEQVGPIGQDIVNDDAQTTTSAGDIVLYSGDQIVVFYGSNSWSYTRLGHADLSQKEMEDLLGNGDVKLTLQMED